MVTLIRHLDRARFEPHLALVKAEGPYLSDVPSDVPVHDLKAGRARYCIPAVLRLAWSLRPQVIISTLGHLNLVLIVAKPLLPSGTALLVREGITVSASLKIDGQHTGIWKWLYRFLYRRADKIICQTNYMLDDLAESFRVPREKMVCIYNPVDVGYVRQLAEEGESPFSGSGPHVISVGRLSNQKGFDLLLDATPILREQFPEVQLTILGDGPLRPALEAQREKLGLTRTVHFVGFQRKPFPFLKHADLFVLCSRYEGLPNVVLEALILGTPVVATACPGGMEELVNYADGLRLVPMDNPTLLAESLVRALVETKNRRSGQINPRIVVNFGTGNIVPKYEALLDQMSDVSSI